MSIEHRQETQKENGSMEMHNCIYQTSKNLRDRYHMTVLLSVFLAQITTDQVSQIADIYLSQFWRLRSPRSRWW
jgi:uncharacterized PurR-regulated membrane protein YhhQ (DUF165 family)